MRTKYIIMLLLLMAGSSVRAQQKANFKLADRFTSRNFRSADRNSMSIYPMYINDGEESVIIT